MPYQLRLRVSNSTAQTITTTIPAGTVFEVIDPFSRIQNLITANGTSFVLQPGAIQVIEIDSWCLNRSFSPPRQTPMRPTPFRSTKQYSGQSDVWGDLGRRR